MDQYYQCICHSSVDIAKKEMPLILISCILLTKFVRIFIDDVRSLVLIYSFLVGILFCFVGAVMAMEQRRLVYRQLIIILLICLPLMILQLAGVGEWTQILRRDAPAEAKEQVPALFVSRADLNISVLQLRPAGLIWAPAFLSIILMFVLGQHFGNTKSRKITWNDVLLCAVIVLAMCKIVFLTLIFLTATAYAPWLATWVPLAGFPKGRSNPLVKGGVHAPPENASVRDGRRSLSRELT